MGNVTEAIATTNGQVSDGLELSHKKEQVSGDLIAYVSKVANESRIPIGVNFNAPRPQGEKVTIAGFELVKYDDLLQRESWFFEHLASLKNNQIKAEVSLTQLGKKVKDSLGLDKLEQGLNCVTKTGFSEEIGKAEEYAEFLLEHMEEFEEVVTSFRLANNNIEIDSLRITYFLKSRYRADWELPDTSMLLRKQIKELLQFIAKEANNGTDPEEAIDVKAEPVTTTDANVDAPKSSKDLSVGISKSK